MKLLKFFGKAGEDPGTWMPLTKGTTPEDSVELLVRRIPVHVNREIARKHGGTKRTVLMKRKGGQITLDGEVSEAETAEAAAYALLDSRRFDMEVGDPDGAAFLSKVVGRELAKGEMVRVDGCWNKEVDGEAAALKKAILTANPEFARKVVTLSKGQDALVEASLEEEEEGKE